MTTGIHRTSAESSPVALGATHYPALPGSAILRAPRPLLLLCAAVVISAAFYWSNPAIVNNHRVPLWISMTADDCARRIGIDRTPGDLLDVRGSVIARGAGAGPRYLLNGIEVSAEQRVRRGDALAVFPPASLVEPTVLKADVLGPSSGTDAGGIRYVERGAVSGRVGAICLASVAPSVERLPAVALTFDDGPNPPYTQQILAALNQHGARATFFVLGCWAAKHPELIARMVAEGHEVGNHTWSHPDCTRISSSAVAAQLQRWEGLLNPIIGGRARYFRPPYGAANGSVRTTAGNLGYNIAMWTADTNDWRRPGADAIYSRAVAGARDGAIILMHDGGGAREQTVAAVKRIVPTLKKKGYNLVTLSQLHGHDPSGAELVFNTDAGPVRLRPTTGIQVIINGRAVEMPTEPVEVDGQLLLPAKPTLPLIGCGVGYDKASQNLRITTPLNTLSMHLHLRTLQVGSRKVFMTVPAVLYRGSAMVPLWVLVDHCGASAAYDEGTRTLYITGTFGPTPTVAGMGGLLNLSATASPPRLPAPSKPPARLALSR